MARARILSLMTMIAIEVDFDDNGWLCPYIHKTIQIKIS